MGEVIDIHTRQERLTPATRNSIQQRLAEIAIQISLLESEQQQLERRLG